jgi:hypothetical protein
LPTVCTKQSWMILIQFTWDNDDDDEYFCRVCIWTAKDR